jgi:hypothetical protein
MQRYPPDVLLRIELKVIVCGTLEVGLCLS